MDLDLRKAIHEHKVIRFEYEGAVRTVEPYTYGRLKTTENLMVSGFFVDGFSKSAKGQGWRLYSIAKITNLCITDVSFLPNRDGYNREDSRMGEIYAAA
jgi:predicted DNA-binding transcriptional regulator YafY